MNDAKERKELRRIRQVLKTFMDVKAEMNVGLALAFIEVALHEGASMNELKDICGTKQSTMSRQLLDLGQRDRRMQPGLGLVDSRIDPMELRKKNYTLSPQGRRLIEELRKALA